MTMELKGYIRSDNRVGFRNHIAIIPLAGCVQQIAFKIAAEVEDVIALWQPLGCDLQGDDQQRLGQMLYQLATHPNVGATIFITMGCAATNTHKLSARTEKFRPVKTLNMHRLGGTTSTVEAGVKAAHELAELLKEQKRESVPFSSIVLGTKCGASDKTSFEVCHPVVGAMCDCLVDAGSTVVLSEDFELYPTIGDLAERAIDEKTAQRILDMSKKQKDNWKYRCNLDIDKVWGKPEDARNKSLGHILKAGNRPIHKVFRLGENINEKGLVVLDGPNSDLISVTSLMASGCNLLLFTTGRGTPIACPLVPTIKITANDKTYEKMVENTDVLVGTEETNNSDRIIETIVKYANGTLTKGELMGHGEMFIPLEGVTF